MRHQWISAIGIPLLLAWIGFGFTLAGFAESPEASRYPGASHVPDSQPGWKQFLTKADPNAPKDEPQGGRTAQGSPVAKRIEECFPAEPRNLFWEVDKIAGGPGGQLVPLNYDLDGDGKISDQERDAIRGQNTWMLWGEGNEAFWGWLQERGYGLVDFLILLDSRQRNYRFRDSGLINQPGMKEQTDPGRRVLGLYLDQADGEAIKLKSPDGEKDGDGNLLTGPPQAPPGHPELFFRPGDRNLYESVIAQLPKDGVDYNIYGYPSGVIGLRFMPNPDFFGDTPQAAKSRKYWMQRVVNAPEKDAYYKDPEINADPQLVRPFRPSMACAFCHVGPHPLSPPKDPEKPEWRNLSSIIGNQYWVPKKAFANLTRPDNFLHHFLASQQAGTIDTSLVSTDHINNANTINAIFEISARLERANENPPEYQGRANMLMESIEDGFSGTNPRHTPRVLLDGADSIGVFGALSRVYLNIGTYPEEWSRCHNPVVGFKPQRPFSIANCQANSVYWRTAEKFRIRYLKAFFALKGGQPSKGPASAPPLDAPSQVPVQNESTAPMKLVFAGREGQEIIEKDKVHALAGRTVFLQNCAVCHSSKQPEGFSLTFSPKWRREERAAAGSGQTLHLTLPMSYADWESFKRTPAYQDYVQRIVALAGQPGESDDLFIKNNYLSTDIRVPITLVGTNSGRSVGTNAMRGQVWDNYSSEEYKNLPAVGPVHFYNPYSGVQPDSLGMNDAYYPPAGGPGYYRPASLVSLWATAPYLHNNALGFYNQEQDQDHVPTRDPDVSVQGRLAAFQDGITKLLWNAKRAQVVKATMGDLRLDHQELTKGDPGFIYRTTQESYIVIPRKFIEPLLLGVIGSFWTSFLSLYLWIILLVVLLLLTAWGEPRIVALVLVLLALILAAGLVITRFDRVYWALWLLPVILVGGALWFWLGRVRPFIARISLAALALLSLCIGLVANLFVGGALADLRVGPIPQGTPVNLIMNMNPEAPTELMLKAGTALLRGAWMVKARGLKGESALHTFEKEAGLPLLTVSKCPDFVLDRGHWFGEALSDDEKQKLIAFLKTL